jgi:hypothetical protein
MKPCNVHAQTAFGIVFALLALHDIRASDFDQPWQRHVIDDSSRGADGTRLADANGDGLLDVVTGWEQGGIVRVYLHPGHDRVRDAWPAVTVGSAASVEDAVLVDLDGDGAMDVVSCCEGNRQAMLVHWARADRYLDPDAWSTQEIPASRNQCRWMFAAAMDVDMDGQVDVVAGGKGPGSQLGWWKVPKDRPRDLSGWLWHPMRRKLGWVMSIETVDMDADGDVDVLFTDRKGDRTGCFWLEHPGIQDVEQPWPERLVGVRGREAMFLSRADLDRDGLEDVIVAMRPHTIVVCRRLDRKGTQWRSSEIKIPLTFGSAKDAAAADLDGDGSLEIVFSTEGANNGKYGIGRIVDPLGDQPRFTSISGVDGVKHDLVELIDLDGDGDLDLLTCEEVKNLGVIWYENPSSPTRQVRTASE